MGILDFLNNIGPAEMSAEERKRALKMAALQAGAGMLSNNTGHYGAFSPAAGAGLSQGLLGYQQSMNEAKTEAEKRKRAEMMRGAFEGAISRPTIQGQEMQGYGVGGNWAKDQDTAGFMSKQARDINDLLVMQPSRKPGAETFGLMDAPLIKSELLPGMTQPEPLVDYQQEAIMRQMNPESAFDYQKQYGIPTPNPDGSMTLPTSFAQSPLINPAEVQQEQIIPQTMRGPDTQGPEQFDMLKAARQLMQTGDPELMQQGFKIYAELKASKADGPFGKVMPANYTPESLQAFSQSGDYSVLKPLLSGGAGFGNVNPGQFTPESLSRYAETGNYSDLVPLRTPMKVDAGNEEILIDPVTRSVIGRYPKKLAPNEAATIQDRRREMDYDLPQQNTPPKTQSFGVTAPDGKTYTFKTKKDADNFRMSIGGK
jgi:hypothetical protein